MKKRHLILSICALALLPSCLFQQAYKIVVKEQYPNASMPPSVIADVNGSPASNKWIKIDPEDLPPSGAVQNNLKNKALGPNGIPYGGTSKWSNIVISPHEPNHILNYKGFPVGAKVWDPYTRKAFYIPRSYTIN